MSARLAPSDLRRVFARLLFVQASLNRKGMQNIGVLYALDAAASKLSREPMSLLARHNDHFNTNPNAVPIVVGSVLRIEDDGLASAPVPIARFKQAACSALAATGDVLMVGGLKPLALTLAVVSAIYSFSTGLVAIVVLYNATLLAGRAWGLRFGYARGWGIVDAFTGPRVQRVVMLARILAAFAGGAMVAVIARRAFAASTADLALMTAATLGAWIAIKRGVNVARLAIVLFPLVVVVAMLVK
ncbi:MAG TPA: PTS system mannose/fructose/sorbose family transporter subunit IID [Candidatus Krumholzibacteria bacterium]|nr:PTS system mannose/fructose/sorbose family transporter subunit IID [Candidatus Krumholzibacteria bacterium]